MENEGLPRQPLTASLDATERTVQYVHVETANQFEFMHDSKQQYFYVFIPHHIDYQLYQCPVSMNMYRSVLMTSNTHIEPACPFLCTF